MTIAEGDVPDIYFSTYSRQLSFQLCNFPSFFINNFFTLYAFLSSPTNYPLFEVSVFLITLPYAIHDFNQGI